MCCFQHRSEPVQEVKFDHDYLEYIRQQSINKIPVECSDNCKDIDYFPNERLRAPQQDCWDESGTKIKKLHLKQGLICNLQCISCSSALSSAWNTHYHIFDPLSKPLVINKKQSYNWQHLDLSNLSELHFDGGEPFLNKENTAILEDLDQQGILPQISLTYNTNGTIYPDNKLLNLWNKVKWVRLYVSLDGTESVFEYTRYPAKWQEVEYNLLELTKISGPCILLEVNAVVGIHNVFNIKQFYTWWQNKLPVGNQGDPSQIFVKSISPDSVGGEVLSLKHLPLNLTDSVIEYVGSIGSLAGSDSLLTNISSDPNNKWVEYLEKLDHIRGTNWKKDLPQELHV